MFFLNLSLGEFFTLLGVVGGLITALYLLDKSKRKKVVSTLRFWTPARSAEELQSRRRMRDPWSLLLQLLGLVLLLLAIAQLQWGSKRWRGHDHVLLLDTSAWSAAKTASGTVLDEEKRLALDYLAALPGTDRVMFVRVDSLTTPVTPFTNNRTQLRAEISGSVSAVSALNLEQALAFATQAQQWAEGAPGEIVYTGPHMISGAATDAETPANLRILPVDLNREHVGIQHLTAKRDQAESNAWEATVTLKNFGTQPHAVRLQTRYAGTQFAQRLIQLAPRQESAAEYRFVTPTAGELLAQVTPADSLPSDQEARLRLPRSGPLQVTVYTSRSTGWRPLLEANHRLIAHFFEPAQYPSASDPGEVVVLDTFVPRVRPAQPTLWIDPPRESSPVAVKGIDYDSVIKTWHNETVLGAGLHAKEAHIANAEIFETFEGDIPVANVAGGPIVLARDGGASHQPRFGVIGFDPLQERLRFETTVPILFANFLRWLSPEAFRTLDLSSASVGTASIALDPNERTDQLRVIDDKGLASPFTVRGGMLQLFSAEPSILHIYSGDRERILSLTLPEVADTEWKIPADAARGVPRRLRLTGAPVDLWKWLAMAGLGCLLAEWFLFGRQRRAALRAATNQKASGQREPELVAK
jgi:hypothetical protein